MIDAKRPKFFLAENVKGITNLAKGKVFQMILKDFTELGYKVKHKILNAADYGVPQTRQRVIIIGVRNDINFEYIYPLPTNSKNGKDGLPEWISVSEAMAHIPDPDLPNDLPNHVYSKYKLNFNGYLGHRPLDPDKPAPTVTARGDNKGGVVILPHPNGKRRMSCRELATVQSFPLNYEFCGNNSSVYRQIGNAVPPLLGRAVDLRIGKCRFIHILTASYRRFTGHNLSDEFLLILNELPRVTVKCTFRNITKYLDLIILVALS